MNLNTKLTAKQSSEVTDYLINRWNQLSMLNYFAYSPLIIKCETYQVLLFEERFYEESYQYAAIYLYDNFRAKGAYKNLVQKFNESDREILVMEGCGLGSYLKHIGAQYKYVEFPQEYRIISKYYEGKFAQRSGLPYINHIHEGCLALETDLEKRAFMLHPIFQNGEQDKVNLPWVSDMVKAMSKQYADVANSYLPKDWEKDPPSIPYTIREMLYADKVQNYKDFRAHIDKIDPARHNQLEVYFQKWFKALGVSECGVESWIERLNRKVPVV